LENLQIKNLAVDIKKRIFKGLSIRKWLCLEGGGGMAELQMPPKTYR